MKWQLYTFSFNCVFSAFCPFFFIFCPIFLFSVCFWFSVSFFFCFMSVFFCFRSVSSVFCPFCLNCKMILFFFIFYLSQNSFLCRFNTRLNLETKHKNIKKFFLNFKVHVGLKLLKAYILACLFVRKFVTEKRQNGLNNRAQIICGTSDDIREGLWMIRI